MTTEHIAPPTTEQVVLIPPNEGPTQPDLATLTIDTPPEEAVPVDTTSLAETGARPETIPMAAGGMVLLGLGGGLAYAARRRRT